MLNSGWTKYFTDGNKEVGTDLLVHNGLASWRRGRLDNIRAVRIQDGNYSYVLISSLAREWWQGDRYHARYTGPDTISAGKLVKRFVQFKIEPEHVGKYLIVRDLENGVRATIASNRMNNPLSTLITEEHINKWLSMEITPGLKPPALILKERKG